MSSPVTSTKRLLLGLVVAVGVGALAEGIARIVREPPKRMLVADDATGEPFLIADGLVHPLFQQQFSVPPFPVEATGTRVVFLGASTVHSDTPEVQREAEFPSLAAEALGVEAVNLGVPGAVAADLGDRLDAVLGFDPDLLVVYSGHNAFIRATQTGLMTDPSFKAQLVIGSLLRNSRFFLLLSDHVGPAHDADAQQGFALGPTEREALRREHIAELAELIDRSTVPVILVTMVSNPFTAPVANDCPEAYSSLGLAPPHPGAEAKPPNLQGISPEQTLPMSEACEQGRYLHARAVWDAGRVAEGRALLDAIRNDETLPMRADAATNERIRALAAETGTPLVDADVAFREAGRGLEPETWMEDAVHPNSVGHEALAALIAPRIAEVLGLPDPGLDMPSTAPREPPANRQEAAELGGGDSEI